jgi:NMD protein affecting ribosome stability and mRNA decay
MTKYHFEIVDGHTIEDPKGIDLASERQARKVASEIAKQVAADEDTDMKDVVVKTSDGEVVYKTRIKSDSNP